jgi:hypothetical protein
VAKQEVTVAIAVELQEQLSRRGQSDALTILACFLTQYEALMWYPFFLFFSFLVVLSDSGLSMCYLRRYIKSNVAGPFRILSCANH